MSRRTQNRYMILSSSDDPMHDDDNALPPSDPPDPLSDDSDGALTPISRLPRLSTLLRPIERESSEEPDSPSRPMRSTRIRRGRGSSVPPMEPLPGPPTRARGSSVPPSDDLIFTPGAERRLKIQRAQERRRETLQSKKINAKIDEATRLAAEQKQAASHQMQAEKTRLLREQFFDKVLDDMTASKYTLAEFLDYVFNPETKLKSDWRWRGFFLNRPVVERIFGYWTSSKYPATTHATVHEWAASLIAAKTSTEAQSITSSGILTKSKKVVNEQFFLGYSLAGLTATLRGMAPTAFHILDAFSSTARQLRQNSAAGLRKKEILRGSAALSLLRAASQYNNYAQAVNSAYLAATGASRQHFAVFGALGSSLGYTSVVSSNKAAASTINTASEDPVVSASSAAPPPAESEDDEDVDYSDMPALDPPEGYPFGHQSRAKKQHRAKPKSPESKTKTKRKKRPRPPGLLTLLSNACNATSRSIASSGLFVVVYDNINMMVRVAEQILGRKNAQENGTCATLIPLHDTQPADLLMSSLDTSILKRSPAPHRTPPAHRCGGRIPRTEHGFKKWQKDLDAMQPKSSETIDVHKTPIHPLPSMEIDENSITGNIEVMSAINQSLGLNADDPEYIKYIKIVAGDQLTIARQRSILTVRLGHESGAHSWRNIVLMPGLFHAKIADCHGLLETHFGKPNAGTRSPGSLGFHNTVLDHQIVARAHPGRRAPFAPPATPPAACTVPHPPSPTLPRATMGDMHPMLMMLPSTACAFRSRAALPWCHAPGSSPPPPLPPPPAPFRVPHRPRCLGPPWGTCTPSS
ncbi:hypothetical protein C8R44DRAFT_895442 [Mycena epipterygia]|nr:hypothetical protein C8R44DRAFT_895442 [Mycena epipterygia]